MATPAATALSTLVVARESSWGVLGGSPKKYQLQFNSSSMSASQGSADNNAISGDRNPRDSVLLRKDAGGEIAFYIGKKSFPWWLNMVLGGLTTTGAADPWTHTFKVGASLPTFQIEEKFALAAPHYLLYAGCIANTLSMSGGPDGLKEARVGVIAKDGTPSAVQTLTTPTDWTDEVIADDSMAAAADVKFNGSAFAEMASFDLSFSNNVIADDYRMGTLYRGSVIPRRASLTGNLRVIFESLTAYNLAVAGTKTNFDVKWTLGGGHSLQVVVPRITLERKDPQISGDGLVYLDLPYKASKDGTEQSAIKVVMLNDQAGTIYAA